MKISGTFWDRLCKKVLPFTGVTFVLCLFVAAKVIVIAAFVGMTLFMWGMDWLLIHLRYKNLEPLFIEGDALYFGNNRIMPSEIERIEPYQLLWGRIGLEILKFYLTNGQSLKVLDKPVNFFKVSSKEPSKTVRVIIAQYPELTEKLQKTKVLWTYKELKRFS